MGDIADMMLDGTLDEETGEYIGDRNIDRYGMESPGFPMSYEREDRENAERFKKVSCPVCGKRVKATGLDMHKKTVHDK